VKDGRPMRLEKGGWPAKPDAGGPPRRPAAIACRHTEGEAALGERGRRDAGEEPWGKKGTEKTAKAKDDGGKMEAAGVRNERNAPMEPAGMRKEREAPAEPAASRSVRDPLVERVFERGRRMGWWRKDRAVLAAVSGGPDSMAMLHLLKALGDELGFPVLAAHVNHKLRGAEADAEAELVRSTAAGWGVPCLAGEIDVPAYLARTGENAQAAARRLRYEFLRRAARERGVSVIATAHHMDDQAETVLMRLMRGTGPGGLAGIAEQREEEGLELIRPLLRISKVEILQYCERNGVPYATDSSNLKSCYFRNAVRLEVLPFLERYNPAVRSSLVRLAEISAAEDDYLQQAAREAFAALVRPEGDGWAADRSGFCKLHLALQRRLIKLILNCLASRGIPVDFDLVEGILAAAVADAPTVSRMDLGGGAVWLREYDRMVFASSEESAKAFCHVVPFPDTAIEVPEAGLVFRFQTLPAPVEEQFGGDRRTAWFDLSKLKFPLRIRSRETGDRMEPLGLGGSKKVQDIFVDAKIPRSRRDRTPLLADGDGRILWIPGVCRSRHAPVAEGTARVLRVEAAPLEGGTAPKPNMNVFLDS